MNVKTSTSEDSLTSSMEDRSISPGYIRAEKEDFAAIIRRTVSMDKDQPKNMDLKYKEKVINDCIHGTIRIPAAAVLIMDTPQFQRLRNIKQTGTCHLVYPNATHNRFQHSIGVGHLGEKFCKHLMEQYPHLVDAKDVLCVFIAGLCHDLGHGPYSHLWEHFLKEAEPNKNYHHEDTSIKIFDDILKENSLRLALLEVAGIDDQDIIFIKEMIVGPLDPKTGLTDPSKSPEDKVWPYLGRNEKKGFLYEIIANKMSGIDVDKWDYFLRDDYYLKINIIFSYERFINFCKIEKTGEPARRRICLRSKEAENILEMYRDRTRLHKHGYQHKIALIADRMFIDAFKLANPYVKIKGQNGSLHSFSGSSFNDLEAHQRMTDEYVRYKILEDDRPEMIPAQDILKRIEKRDFYKIVGQIDLLNEGKILRDLKNSEILEDLARVSRSLPDCRLEVMSDLTICKTNVELKMNMNDIAFYFYDEGTRKISVCSPTDLNLSLPERDQQLLLRILCKKNEVIDESRKLFQEWKKKTLN